MSLFVLTLAIVQGCPGDPTETPTPTEGTEPPVLMTPTPTGTAEETPTSPQDGEPFGVAILSYAPGEGAGFGQENLPDVVLGPPLGGGEFAGSLDVLSLGSGGEIALTLGVDALNGPGVDILVFENPFNYVGGTPETVFAELGAVSVSQDGEEWFTFECDPSGYPYTGCAGKTPTLSHPDNGIDPRDPEVAGGDGFDLEDVGLEWVRYVRIRDLSEGGSAPSAGFDLDAISAVWSESDG